MTKHSGSPDATAVGLQAFEWVILACAFAYLCLHVLPHAWVTLNTDFPNYFLAAKLARQGADTSRMYEWTWIQRQKDVADIGVRVIGLLPITPFSTLVFLPLTSMSALTAKHVWILANLCLLWPLAWMLQKLTGLGWRRIAIILLLSFPLSRNLLYGQFYIVLLFLIVAGCCAYLSGRKNLAAVLVAIAAACKVFPLLLFVFFLVRREWRALAIGILSLGACVWLSTMVFGVEANRTWMVEVFPWVTRGEGLGTYSLTPSITAIAHGLFLEEPQWNPFPWHRSLTGYTLTTAVVSALTLAPALLLIDREDGTHERVMLEWSALIMAALTISTIPASYNFVLLVFPICVMSSVLLRQQRCAWLAGLLLCYVIIGYPLPTPEHVEGLRRLLYAPRIGALLFLLVGMYSLQVTRLRVQRRRPDWIQYALMILIGVSCFLNVRASLRVQHQQRTEYVHRLPVAEQGYANTAPAVNGTNLYFIRFGIEGYQLMSRSNQSGIARPMTSASNDVLSFAVANGALLVERLRAGGGLKQHTSQIVDLLDHETVIVNNAHDPMVSSMGRDLAFLRDDHGRSRLLLRKDYRSQLTEISLTPSTWNVYEVSLREETDFAVAAVERNGSPRIYLNDRFHSLAPITPEDSRYPALSSDGMWLVYSHRDHGFWNLWLRNERTGITHRISDLPCNQVQPSWESDSKTVVYSTDCGRSIWFGAIARRQVVP